METSAYQVKTNKIKDIERPSPVNSESSFEYDELFFSITDLKSNITFANEIFVRISKYKESEIIGQLHKIIRHPDMPRAVFEVFWDLLKSGKSVAAYVKNMAADGSYYWVMALAVPSKDGYQSIRLKPGSTLFTKVQNIYRETLEYEGELEKTTDKKSALKASVEYLNKKIRDAGFENYESFMWEALQTEISNREEKLPSYSERIAAYKQYSIDPSMLSLAEIMNDLFNSLNELSAIETGLIDHSDHIIQLSGSIILLALNAQVGSAKMEGIDSSLSVIAEKMGEQATVGEEHLTKLQNMIGELKKLTADVNFHIMYSKLQVEMTLNFLTELETSDNESASAFMTNEEAIDTLKSAYMPQLKEICNSLNTIPVKLEEIFKLIREVERFIMTLRFIHITGKVEISRISDSDNSFSTTFQELINEINNAESHLSELSNIIQDNKGLSRQYATYCDRMKKVVRA